MEREVFSKIIRPHAMTTRVEVLCDKQGEKMMTTDYTAAMDTQPLATVAAAQAQPPTYRMDVRFTGSGSEYFRIWIVNVLLLLVTLGLYWPWAKARRLRYFYANTVVGEHPLVFHGQGSSMFKGFLLVLALFGAYTLATNTSLTATVIAVSAIGVLWPALFQRSMRFRLGNTSWRGLRMRFTGTVRDAYLALAPMVVVGVFGVVSPLLQKQLAYNKQWILWLAVASGLVSMVVLPIAFWRLKGYQHRNFGWGPLQTELRLPLRSLYMLGAKAVGFFVLMVGAMMVMGWSMGVVKSETMRGPVMAVMFFAIVALFVILLPTAWAFTTSRWQNLLWSATENDVVRFSSQLRAVALLKVTLLNGLFLVLTLGLYWPFAVVAKTRLRVQALSLEFTADPDTLVALAAVDGGGAVGDAAADFLGVDVGL